MKRKNQEAVTRQPEIKTADVDVKAVEDVDKKTEAKVNDRKPEKQVEDVGVDRILKCYPQYEEVFIDKNGFVFPSNAPEYQRKDAILYKNKYFKK